MEIDVSSVREIRQDPKVMAGMILGCLIFVALGAWMVSQLTYIDDPKGHLLGWLSIATFGLLALVGARRLFTQRGPVLTFSPAGYRDTRYSDDTIPWSNVLGVGEWRNRGQRIVQLKLAPGAESGIAVRLLPRLTRGLGSGSTLSIPHGGLFISRSDLAELAKAYVRAYSKTPASGA